MARHISKKEWPNPYNGVTYKERLTRRQPWFHRQQNLRYFDQIVFSSLSFIVSFIQTDETKLFSHPWTMKFSLVSSVTDETSLVSSVTDELA
jgi:hypothetical protein